MRNSYQDLIRGGLLKKETVGFDQIMRVMERAYRCIKSAETLARDDDEEGGFQLAYEAMLLAGRALVFAHGLRPRAIGSHKIVVEFATRVLGAKFAVLARKFGAMRRKRNYLIYGIGLEISKTETLNAIKTAGEFVGKAGEIIRSRNPQRRLL